MRRMVGAAILVGVVTVLGWLRQPTRNQAIRSHSMMEMPAKASSPGFAPDSVSAPVRNPITHLPNPLAFLSTAGADSLDLLPGVGPVLAARLIAARQQQGGFRSWDDVDRVRGIGPKTLERLKALTASPPKSR